MRAVVGSSEGAERGWAGQLGVQPGLCGGCRHAALVRGPRSAFLRCRLADAHAEFRRYPVLPVERCAGFEPREGGEA